MSSRAAGGGLRRGLITLGAFAVTPVVVGLGLAVGFDPVQHEATRPLHHRQGDIVGSTRCLGCHPDQHASWSDTFHRTMTQAATPRSVLGAFDGRRLDYAGEFVRPLRTDERFFMDLPSSLGRGSDVPAPDELDPRRRATVELTVGSRRYQQYFERVEREGGSVLLRLPWLWHIEQQRWMPVATVFLHPDGNDLGAHRSVWNGNCIFCHNTAPRPGMVGVDEQRPPAAWSFESAVGELGIACESCHGPGRSHAERRSDPWRRWSGADRKDNADDDIVHPLELDQEAQLSLCGQCHGQRLPRPASAVRTYFTDGPTFRSGQRLTDHVEPIGRWTPSPDPQRPDLFRNRFWADGTARLTAYEYQGMLASPCVQRGPMTCNSCHTMHAGDPRGMLPADRQGDGACTQCHVEIAADVAAHTGHAVDSPGSRCLDCHMPPIVYGILDVHRSHRIESPDPARDVAAGRPHACTLCHADKTPGWSARELTRLWGRTYPEPTTRADSAPLDVPDLLAQLHAGDAVQRSIAVAALGHGERLAGITPAQAAAHLAVACGDGYPNIRWLARRSLTRLDDDHALGLAPLLAAWDPADPSERRELVLALLEHLAEGKLGGSGAAQLLVTPDGQLDLAAVTRLLDLQTDHVISIGE